MLPVSPKQTVSMLTRDGIRLDADLYRPVGSDPYPVLLMRQPYGRAIASTVVYAHPRWYAAQGYLVVIQDVRGRGSSQGSFGFFGQERADGLDAVNWAANLPGSNGQVGMYGFSYQGMTQLYAAAQRPPSLKTVCPAMSADDLYADWAYEGGAFRLQANLSWGIQIAAETARLKGDQTAYLALYQASRQLPLQESISTLPQVISQYGSDCFYHDWLEHDQPGSYWDDLSPKVELAGCDLPMLHIGGWFDSFLRGTLNCYHRMAARSQHPQHLIVGPWAHLPWGRKVGSVDFGAAAINPIDRIQIRWFDHFLKGIDTGILSDPPVQLFEMGTNQWRSFSAWPQGNSQSYFLASDGLATMQDGTLQPDPPAEPVEDDFVHDPWRPVPASGGHAAAPSGSFDRSSLDCRSDIVTYTSDPLGQDLHLAGDLWLEVDCSSDSISFDLGAVLSEVRSGGVFNLAEGYRRVDGQSTDPVRLDLQSTCACIPAGNALRVSLSAACFPAYPVNPGNGSGAKASLMEAQVITVTLKIGRSRLVCSVMPTLYRKNDD